MTTLLQYIYPLTSIPNTSTYTLPSPLRGQYAFPSTFIILRSDIFSDIPTYAQEIVMWGVGMPGFRDEQTTMENMRRWFAEPIFDIVHSTWPYQRAIRGVGGICLINI